MWIAARNLCDFVQAFAEFDDDEAVGELIRQLEASKWKIQNVLKNQPKSAADRAKISNPKNEFELTPGGPKVTLDESLCLETQIISDIFSLNELEALDLVLTGDVQRDNFDNLNRGLVSVVCYYDAHRLLCVALRSVLEWEREGLPQRLTQWINRELATRQMLKHLIAVQSSFSVQGEFHMLMQPTVNGLGGAAHQQILRQMIEDVSACSAECVYLVCEWGADRAGEMMAELLPGLKSLSPPDKFSPHHVVSWTALLTFLSPRVIHEVADAGPIIRVVAAEVRDETAWGDAALCASVQLALAVAAKSLSIRVADHAAVEGGSVDADSLVDRAIRSLALQFVRLCVVASPVFRRSTRQVEVVDQLMKRMLLSFPAKVMEVFRNSEDEVMWAEEAVARGHPARPQMHFEHMVRCLADVYSEDGCDDSMRETLDELSAHWSTGSSLQLCHFLELARRHCLPVHSVALLDLAAAVCRQRDTAQLLWNMFYEVQPGDAEQIGWEQLMSALKAYERLFRQQTMGGGGGQGGSQGQAAAVPSIPPEELAGLVAWIRVATVVAQKDDDACAVFAEERSWCAIDAAVGVLTARVPLELKGVVFRFLAALSRRESTAARVWAALAAHNICCPLDGVGISPLQQELEERECAARRFDCSLGFAHLMRALLQHPLPDEVPAAVSPALTFLCRQLLAHLNTRGYEHVSQMWEVFEVGGGALHSLLSLAHADARAVARKQPHIGVLLQLLNDSPLLRCVCWVLCEDSQTEWTGRAADRPSARASVAALRLLSRAAHTLPALRTAVRAADSDALLSPLESLLLSPLPANTHCTGMTLAMGYVAQFADLPVHALLGARLLRELSSVRPSLHRRMAEAMRARQQQTSQVVRAVTSLFALHHGHAAYNNNDLINRDLDESDVSRVRGETARVMLEVLSEGVEQEPHGPNLAHVLLAFQAGGAHTALYHNDCVRTGLHSLLEVVDRFIAAPDPFTLPYSALFEPVFRLMLRLVSLDCAWSVAVLRHLRQSDVVYRLVCSPFLRQAALAASGEAGDDETATLTKLIAGNILHLAALEISSLLRGGHFSQPQRFYCALLESRIDGEESQAEDGSSVAGTTNGEGSCVLFDLLRLGGQVCQEDPVQPNLVYFDANKLYKLVECCEVSSSGAGGCFQVDVARLHAFLRREVLALQMADATVPTQEMECVLSWCAWRNAWAEASAAASTLLSGCTATVNVFALFAPVPFFSTRRQLDVLSDAAFLLIEVASAHGGELAVAVTHSLQRVSRAVCSLARAECVSSGVGEVRACVARLLAPLLELIVQPGERPIQAKMCLYECARVCIRACYEERKEGEEEARVQEGDWLFRPLAARSEDPVRALLDSLAGELVHLVASDIVDLPIESKAGPLGLLADVLWEDARGSRKVAGLVARSGLPRHMTDLLAGVEMDFVALHQRDTAAVRSQQLYSAILLSLTRLCLSDCGWTSLADVSAPELLVHMQALHNPPKQVFLQPETVNSPDSPSFYFARALDQAIHLCLAMCAHPKWKRMSLQMLAVLQQHGDLLCQLLRAEVNCKLVDLAAALANYIHDNDESVREWMDAQASMRLLRARRSTAQPPARRPLATATMNQFNTPSRLLPAL